MHPILFTLGSFELASYGLMTALAYAVASFYLYKRLPLIKLDKDTFWNIVFIAFMAALVGAKLLYLIVSWPEMGTTWAQRLGTAIKDFRYGFVFFGGAIAAIGAVVYYLKRKKLPLLPTGDFFMVALPLGHAIGRVGCFLAGCCFGHPTTLPWGVAFTDPHSLVAREYLGVPLHPTQLYEVAANLILFFILQHMYKKPHKNGTIVAAYVIGYGVIRFGIEFFRGDFRGEYIGMFSPSQLIALLALAAGAALWWFLKKDTSHAG